jgi:hypothetical protein
MRLVRQVATLHVSILVGLVGACAVIGAIASCSGGGDDALFSPDGAAANGTSGGGSSGGASSGGTSSSGGGSSSGGIPPGWVRVDDSSCVDIASIPPAGATAASSCTYTATCGGSPEGTWSARASCMPFQKVFAQAYGICSALSESPMNGTVTGRVTLANGVITRDLTMSFSAAVNLPNACTGCRCSDQQARFQSAGINANCSPVCNSGTCTCFVDKKTTIQDSEPYTVSGNVITTASGRTYSFCAKPETLTLVQTAPTSETLGQFVLSSPILDNLEVCGPNMVGNAPRDCPPCSQKGVCQGTAIAHCRGKDGWECGSTSPDYEPKETKCDGLDNDCNGKVDENKKTCADLGATCGEPDDGCGGKLSCGTCIAPETCGGGGVPLKCGCTPSCQGKCGGSNGCGGVCPNICIAPETCGGGGVPDVCGCTKTTCAAAGAQCGAIPDLCGGTRTCPDCTGTTWCGGAGVANKCGCLPSTADGPRSPTVGLDDATHGTRVWSVPARAIAADSLPTEISAMINSEVSHFLVTKGYGFNVPSFATIQGIKVEWLRSALSGPSSNLVDDAVRLVKGGTILATDRASATEWPTTAAYATYGGPTDLWGTTWTPADVNSADFGAALAVKYTSIAGNNWPYVDHARVTVYFSATCP